VIFQFRLELRWLQASESIFILMIVIALTGPWYKNNIIRYSLSILLVTLFLLSEQEYLYKGAKNIFYSTGERIGTAFGNAIENGVIRKGKTKLYIWQKKQNKDRDDEIQWCLVGGYFFELYKDSSMKIIFIDSLYQRQPDSSFAYALPDFNINKDEVVLLKITSDDQSFTFKLRNITNEYLKDSLKSLEY